MLTHPRASALVFVTLTPIPPTTLAALARAVDVLAARDDRLEVSWQADGSAVDLGGTDDDHVEHVIDALKREFSVTAATSRPRVDIRRALVDGPGGRTWVDLEPWMDVVVQTRAFYVPRLREAWPRLENALHGGPEKSGVVLRCSAPLAEVFGLRRAVHDMTHGEASATVVLSGYASRDQGDEPGATVSSRVVRTPPTPPSAAAFRAPGD